MLIYYNTRKMGRKNRARDGLRSERSFYPELGVRHPVIDTDEIAFFFSDVATALGLAIPDVPVLDGAGRQRLDKNDEPRVRRRFRVYDNFDRMGVSILERRLPAEYARKHRVRWTRQDTGRIRGDIQNEIGRLDLADRPLVVNLTNVVRLGDADAEADNSRKLGLIIDQASTEAEFLVREHAISIRGIQSSLNRFRYPYSHFVPHLTVARVFRDVPNDMLNGAVDAVQKLLPVQAELQPVRFTLEQEV